MHACMHLRWLGQVHWQTYRVILVGIRGMCTVPEFICDDWKGEKVRLGFWVSPVAGRILPSLCNTGYPIVQQHSYSYMCTCIYMEDIKQPRQQLCPGYCIPLSCEHLQTDVIIIIMQTGGQKRRAGHTTTLCLQSARAAHTHMQHRCCSLLNCLSVCNTSTVTVCLSM